jgi:hypothetical protein
LKEGFAIAQDLTAVSGFDAVGARGGIHIRDGAGCGHHQRGDGGKSWQELHGNWQVQNGRFETALSNTMFISGWFFKQRDV